MYHRQAVHFLAKQDYPSALAAVERARMIALSSLDQVYLENYNIYNIFKLGSGGHAALRSHRGHPGALPAQDGGLPHLADVCRTGM